MLMWQVAAVLAAFAAAGVLLAAVTAPLDIVRAIIYSPPGQALVGRIAAIFTFVYASTENSFFALATSILVTNATTIATVLASPPALHAAHTIGMRSRRGPGWLMRAGWELPQTIMLFVSLYLAGFTGFSMGVVATTRAFAAFMLPEGAYVALASSIVYMASRLPYEELIPRYGSMLRKALPAIIALMVVSAVVEAYEILQ